jgi:hypothetical protein
MVTSNTPQGGYSVKSSLAVDKCLGGYFKFLISKHSPAFLFFIPVKRALKRIPLKGVLKRAPLEGVLN